MLRLLTLYLVTSSIAWGASFSVSPVRLSLSAQKANGSILLRNHGAEPVLMQVMVNRWAQENGADQFEPSKELLVTPPVFTVAAGGAQTLRIGLRRPPASTDELAYRIFVQELPQQSAAAGGLNVAVRLSLPVFVRPMVAKAPIRLWAASIEPDQKLAAVQLENIGPPHLQISTLRVVTGEGAEVGELNASNYLLAGQKRIWSVPVDSAHALGAGARVVAATNEGDVIGPLTLSGQSPLPLPANRVN